MLSLLAAYMKGLFLFLFLHFGVSHFRFGFGTLRLYTLRFIHYTPPTSATASQISIRQQPPAPCPPPPAGNLPSTSTTPLRIWVRVRVGIMARV